MKTLPLAFCVAAIQCSAFAAPPTYDVQRIVAPQGAVNQKGWHATGLNATGMVVGHGWGSFRGTVETGMKQIHAEPALTDRAVARGVDDAGNAVGYGTFDGSFTAATLYPMRGPAQNLGALIPEAYYSEASAISARGGWVVGDYQANVNRKHVSAAFIWSRKTGMQRIGDTEAGDYTLLYDVNDAGHVIGRHDAGQFFWTADNGFVEIPVNGTLSALNNHDEVTGSIYDSEHASLELAFFLPRRSHPVMLPSPPSAVGSCHGVHLNASAQVVGSCQTDDWGTNSHAVLWWAENGGYTAVDLNDQAGIEDRSQIDKCRVDDDSQNAGRLNYRAVAINDAGQILVEVDCDHTVWGANLMTPYGVAVLTPR